MPSRISSAVARQTSRAAIAWIESGGALRIRDALFAGADPGTGELVAAG